MPLAAVALACGLSATVRAAPARADSMRIDVDADQSASVDGRSASLKSVIAELCERSGVRLVDYKASDREIAAHYADVPLKDLLPRLLNRESFVVGLRTGDSGAAPLVSTLRVIGDKPTDALSAAQRKSLGEALSGAVPRPHPPSLQIPPEVLDSNFRSDSPTDHEEAARFIAERLLGDAQARQRFLAGDSEVLAHALGRYEYSADILTLVRNAEEDAAVVAKLNEIIISVQKERQK
jgi:hypothetical protein